MVNGFKVITPCGSTRFKDEFLEAQKRLTLDGNIVISVGLFGHSGDNEVWTEGVKDMLDRQHLAKIDLADEIFVINVGGYIGDSTRREIAYAESKGKAISYLEECRKASIYDNYAALGELHESGKLSDEDWEKAECWFDEKRIEASVVYTEKVVNNMEEEMKKQEYDKWVSKVCTFLVDESAKLNVTCGTFQSKPILDKQPDVVILGYNPHETGTPLPFNKIKERFYEGNPDFKNRENWPVWIPLRWSFEWAGYTNPIKDGHFVFFNAVYFGTNKIDDFKKLPGSNEAIKKCLHFTEEVIQEILKPKCIVCLSVPECFDNLDREFTFLDVKRIDTIQETDADLIEFAMNKKDKGWKCRYSCKNKVKKGFWNGIPIYGIPHTSGSVSNDDWGAIALYLRSEMQKLGI